MNILGTKKNAEETPAAAAAKVAQRAPTRRELQNELATELLDGIRRLANSTTELVGAMRGNMVNSVLKQGYFKLDTNGIWSDTWRVPMGSLYVANHGSGDVIVTDSTPGADAPGLGVGIARVPAGTFAVVNLASANVTLYGTASEFVGVQIFAKPQPPVAGVLVGEGGPGTIVTAVGTDPAAGAEISETVPVGQEWDLLAIRFTLVTDATVLTRAPSITIDDGTNTILRIAAASTQAASLTIAYNWMADLGYEKTASSSNVQGSFPRLRLPAGYRIRTNTGGPLQAGDNYGAPVLHYRKYT